jgi:hypothetical protein
MQKITWSLEFKQDGMVVVFDVAGRRVAFNLSQNERLLWAASFSINISARLAAEIVQQVLSERLFGWLAPWNQWRLKFVRAALNTEAMGNLGAEAETEEIEAKSERRNPWAG